MEQLDLPLPDTMQPGPLTTGQVWLRHTPSDSRRWRHDNTLTTRGRNRARQWSAMTWSCQNRSTVYLGMNQPTLQQRKFLFNDVLNTFYLRLYGVGHMVKDHLDSERGNLLPPLHQLLFPINSKGSFICTISQTG